MPDLPIMLRVRGWRCVIVGGGPVAVRRAQALLECGAHVTVIAPEPDAALRGLAVDLVERAYELGDIEGALLAVIATDNPRINDQAQAEAQRLGVLVNRADDGGLGDVAIPAHVHDGPVTLAVHTHGISAKAAAAIRDELHAKLDPDWPRLLAAVAPYRARIQQAMDDPTKRRLALIKLTDDDAMATLKTEGPEALIQRCEQILAWQ